MYLQKRIIDRHGTTIGYKVGNRNLPLDEIVRLAWDGKIKDVVVRTNWRSGSQFVAAKKDNFRMSKLPVLKQKDIKSGNLAIK